MWRKKNFLCVYVLFMCCLCDVRFGGIDLPACQNLFPFISFLYSFQSMSVLSLFGEMGDGVYGVPSYLLILLVLLNGAMSHPS